MGFALGCLDCEAGQQLIDRPPDTLEKAFKEVRTFQLSLRAIACRQRAVRSVPNKVRYPRSVSLVKVERYNRTLMDEVRCYVDGFPKRCDQYLGQLAGVCYCQCIY